MKVWWRRCLSADAKQVLQRQKLQPGCDAAGIWCAPRQQGININKWITSWYWLNGCEVILFHPTCCENNLEQRSMAVDVLQATCLYLFQVCQLLSGNLSAGDDISVVETAVFSVLVPFGSSSPVCDSCSFVKRSAPLSRQSSLIWPWSAGTSVIESLAAAAIGSLTGEADRGQPSQQLSRLITNSRTARRPAKRLNRGPVHVCI